MKKNLKLAASLLLLIFVFSACKKDDYDDSSSGKQLFVSATPSASLSSLEMKALAATTGFNSFNSFLQYDVDFMKIVYKTNYKGRQIEASGTLAIPKGVAAPPSIVSAQHGTMFPDAAAPSNFPAPAAFSGFELLASVGYITIIPDFIGYGESKDIVHPYYDMALSGTCVADMIKACQYYLRQQSIASSNRLFLMGYSEGGYVTLAAEREIETHPIADLSLKGAAAGAGGYDISGVLDAIASTPTYEAPSFLALFLSGYNVTYDWNRPMSDFFQEPYASRIPALLDGSKDADAVNEQLTTSTSALFNPTFYANLKNTNEEKTLKQAVADNSFPNWIPQSPTLLFHGTADQTVPFQTSQSTYDKFTKAGAANVQLIPIPGGDHKSSIIPMMQQALPWIISLDK